ncbi:heme oxygenase-like domain-containing protein [Portibacter lacus]|uniref:Heme oxygenase n=1 Tax=Portibacter lacus TaxID=1099794 RepID=A0AA37SQS5_9BACT|nr:hypothetical protein [Portibacter lacus]GLR18100.1 hypothetical protein GCM10007940_27150 [Portibacter lacus]
MSSSPILDLLRAATMPIHQKLDNGGIGNKIRNKTFDLKDYQNWLLVTRQTNQMLFSEKINFSDSQLYHFLDFDLGLTELAEDIRLNFLNLEIEKTESSITPISDQSYHPDYLIALLYTFLGSSLGSMMILKYVSQNIPEASTIFLEKMSHLQPRWNEFKKEIQYYPMTITDEELSTYSKLIFEQIFQIQSNT